MPEPRFDELCEHINRVERSRLGWKILALVEGGLIVFVIICALALTGFLRVVAVQQQRVAEEERQEAMMQRDRAEQFLQEGRRAAEKLDAGNGQKAPAGEAK